MARLSDDFKKKEKKKPYSQRTPDRECEMHVSLLFFVLDVRALCRLGALHLLLDSRDYTSHRLSHLTRTSHVHRWW